MSSAGFQCAPSGTQQWHSQWIVLCVRQLPGNLLFLTFFLASGFQSVFALLLIRLGLFQWTFLEAGKQVRWCHTCVIMSLSALCWLLFSHTDPTVCANGKNCPVFLNSRQIFCCLGLHQFKLNGQFTPNSSSSSNSSGGGRFQHHGEQRGAHLQRGPVSLGPAGGVHPKLYLATFGNFQLHCQRHLGCWTRANVAHHPHHSRRLLHSVRGGLSRQLFGDVCHHKVSYQLWKRVICCVKEHDHQLETECVSAGVAHKMGIRCALIKSFAVCLLMCFQKSIKFGISSTRVLDIHQQKWGLKWSKCWIFVVSATV